MSNMSNDITLCLYKHICVTLSLVFNVLPHLFNWCIAETDDFGVALWVVILGCILAT